MILQDGATPHFTNERIQLLEEKIRKRVCLLAKIILYDTIGLFYLKLHAKLDL